MFFLFRGLLFNPLIIFCFVTFLPGFSPFSMYLIVFSETPDSLSSSISVSPSPSLISRSLFILPPYNSGNFQLLSLFTVIYDIILEISYNVKIFVEYSVPTMPTVPSVP